MARPDNSVGGIVRPRRDVIPEGGTPPVVPDVTGTVPTGPSGTPIITVGGGIEGPPAPATPAPVSPVVPIPPAPEPTPEPAPQVPGPAPEVMGPPDWWDAMPVESRDDLIRQIETLQANTGTLETQLAQERNARLALEDRLANLPTPGEPKLDALVANPPWATPDQIPRIPPIPPDFRSTNEFNNLLGANVGQDQQLGRLRRDVDNVALGTGNAQAEVGALRRLIEGISANPNLVPIPPSAQMVSDSISAYFSLESNRAVLKGDRGLKGDKGDKGEKGDPGPSLPPDQVSGAVERYLAANPPPAGRDGRPGRDGTNGVDGRTPTPDEVRGVVETVFAGLPGFLSEPAEYIWQVILQGIRARFEALFEAVTAEE